MSKVQILGVNFDNITAKQALEKIEDFIAEDKFHYIVTPNPEIVVAAQKNPKYKEILNQANLSVPDGSGILFASKCLHKNIKEKIHGTDLVIDFLPIASQKGYKIYLLGAKPGIAEIAKKAIESKYPSIKIVGAECGPFFHEVDLESGNHPELEDTIKRVNQAHPDLLIIGFGAPKQEEFIYKYKDKLQAKVAIGTGGAIDYISGVIPRAPRWMRRLGLEWLYRLFTQPKRIRRIFTATIVFPCLVLKNAIFKKD